MWIFEKDDVISLTTPSSVPNPSEIKHSKLVIVKIAQDHHFDDELKLVFLRNHSKRFATLSPILYGFNILRVGGRLSYSSRSHDSKHPPLAGHKNLSQIIIHHFHLKDLPSGPKTTQSLVLQEFWIVSLRSEVRSVIRKCLKCFRFPPQVVQPPMAPLASSRVNPQCPFSIVGIDYPGPFKYKSSLLRNCKILQGYLCIFVCFITKAKHLEFVSDLTIEGFLASLQHFSSCHALPSDIYSDNGSNFRGCQNYKLKHIKFISFDKKNL